LQLSRDELTLSVHKSDGKDEILEKIHSPVEAIVENLESPGFR